MKKNTLIIGGIVALALLLASAAFVGGRLLNGGQKFAPRPSGGRVQPAEELPQKAADLFGNFSHRQDKSIFMDAAKFGEGSSVEVFVTTRTIIYKDVTMRQYNGRVPEDQMIQQVLEPGSLDEIGEGSLIEVWGTKRGSRYITDVLVYTVPEIFTK